MTALKHRTLLSLAVFAAVAASAPALAAPALNSTDRTFLKDVTASNQKEIDISNAAVRQASSPKVKAFAHTMVRDHTNLSEAMSKLNDGSVPAPASPDAPDADLAAMSGADFDKAYRDKMVGDHDATVAKLVATASDSQFSASVRATAKKALPTIRHHDAMAKALDQSLASSH